MPENRFNLLAEGLLSLRLNDGSRRKASLPQVLALLSGDSRVAAFEALQLHQQHALHAFLVQLAAIALHAEGEEKPWLAEEDWARALRRLSRGDDAPWCLVVPDLSKPAFMQPPVPEGTLEAFAELSQPDGLDILLTAKNHDVKAHRIASPAPEHWLLALLTLQTMQGFLGATNYGIARMNGGFSSRPAVALTPSQEWGPRFRHDVAALLEHRAAIAADRYPEDGGKALLWLEPWDGTKALELGECDPFFIEVCRRIRLVEADGSLRARSKGTEVARIDAKEAHGNTGDPWTPVAVDGKALTVSGSGFSYVLTHELLFGSKLKPGAAQSMPQGSAKDCGVFLTASVLVRGSGKTEGFHQRVVPIPGKVRLRLGQAEGREQIGQLSGRRIKVVDLVSKSVLRPALLALLQADPKQLDFKDERPRRWIDALDSAVDAVFFEQLFSDADLPPAEADRRWEKQVLDLALIQLLEAMQSVPLPEARRYRALSAAERVFYGARKKHFSELLEGGCA